jgi:hypothetical protein
LQRGHPSRRIAAVQKSASPDACAVGADMLAGAMVMLGEIA